MDVVSQNEVPSVPQYRIRYLRCGALGGKEPTRGDLLWPHGYLEARCNPQMAASLTRTQSIPVSSNCPCHVLLTQVLYSGYRFNEWMDGRIDDGWVDMQIDTTNAHASVLQSMYVSCNMYRLSSIVQQIAR